MLIPQNNCIWNIAICIDEFGFIPAIVNLNLAEDIQHLFDIIPGISTL